MKFGKSFVGEDEWPVLIGSLGHLSEWRKEKWRLTVAKEVLEDPSINQLERSSMSSIDSLSHSH